MSRTIPFRPRTGRPLSGWYTEPDDPAPASAPLLLAIHGGSYTSHYWAYDAMGADTLPAIAAASGLPVLAVDRPGFGPEPAAPCLFAQQAEQIVATTVDLLAGPLAVDGQRRNVVVVGHSIGGMLATLIAARHATEVGVAGIDISGYGPQYRPGTELDRLREIAALTEPVPPNPAGRVARFFGPEGTWDAAVAEEDARYAAATQPLDIADCVGWPKALPDLAADVSVPVNYCLAELDSLWTSDASTLEAMRALFVRAPRFEASLQPGAGHCGQLHRNAADTLRRTVDFAISLTTDPSEAGPR